MRNIVNVYSTQGFNVGVLHIGLLFEHPRGKLTQKGEKSTQTLQNYFSEINKMIRLIK